jgi:RNA polymerase sigma-70 factor (ECF subfamily)
VLSRFRDVAMRAGMAHGLRGEELDEVLQDVRIRLWHAGASAGKLETLTASYVYQAASSAALDLLRRRRARREQLTDELLPDGPLAATSTPSADRALVSQETVAAVGAALEELVPSRRAVVRMHLLGYKREEIADLLRWSEAKTRNLLYRGLDDLRQLLIAQGIGPEGAR